MQGILRELTDSIRRQCFIFTCSLALLCASLTERGGAEVWTDSTGTHSVTAEFLGLEGDIVTLRGANGKQIPISLAKLDAASRSLAEKLGNRAVPAPANAIVASMDDANELEKLALKQRSAERDSI